MARQTRYRAAALLPEPLFRTPSAGRRWWWQMPLLGGSRSPGLLLDRMVCRVRTWASQGDHRVGDLSSPGHWTPAWVRWTAPHRSRWHHALMPFGVRWAVACREGDQVDWAEAGRGWGQRAAEWAYLFEPYARPANQLLFDRLDVSDGVYLLDTACGAGSG